jgi:hypothetical protein
VSERELLDSRRVIAFSEELQQQLQVSAIQLAHLELPYKSDYPI